MIEGPGLRLLLSVVFVGAGLLCAYRCLRGAALTDRISEALHLLMCAAMFAMLWPWGMSLPVLPQVLLFALAAAWFLVLLALRGAHRHETGRLGLVHHVLMMAAMAWMVAVMPLTMHAGHGQHSAGGATGGHHGHGAAVADTGPGAPTHVVLVGVLAALVMVAAAVWWLGRALDTARGVPALTPVGGRPGAAHRLRAGTFTAESAMSLGMAVMAVTLAS